MKKASVRDLHIRTSELVRAAAEGEVITIERRGEPVAELRPIPTKREKARQERERRELVAKVFAEMKPIWEKMPKLDSDSGRWLEENR
jgi:prevent-host-death family protein